jgi:hypothetical protein
LCFV